MRRLRERSRRASWAPHGLGRPASAFGRRAARRSLRASAVDDADENPSSITGIGAAAGEDEPVVGFDRGPGDLASKLRRFKPLPDTSQAEEKPRAVKPIAEIPTEEGASLVEEWEDGDPIEGNHSAVRVLGGAPTTITKNAQTSRVVYEVLRVSHSGRASSIVLSKKDILRHLGVAPRDLRRVDPSLSLTTTPPALLVRDKALLLNLGSVRAIVTKKEMFIFEPWRDAGQAFLQNFRERLDAKRSDVDSLSELPADRTPLTEERLRSGNGGRSVHLDASNAALIADDANVAASNSVQFDIPFELDAVEAALVVATQSLEEMMIKSSQRLSDMMSSMPSQSKVTAERLEELRRVKQVLLQLDARAGALRQTLLDILDDDEDVRGMVFIDTAENEAGKEMDDAIEEEVENLIEYYLQRHETCHSEAERLLSGARDLEESLSVSLSSRRYEVTRMELTLSIASFATSLGAMVAGIFGMNLQSRLEMSVTAFYGTSAAIVLGAVTIFFFIFRLMKSKLIL